MLELLDKASRYIAVLIIGYLTYTAMDQRKGFVNEGKEIPTIARSLLSPKLIEPNDHASPTSRDPFMVLWDMYSEGGSKPASPGSTQTHEGPRSDGAGPAVKLMAVLVGSDGHDVALIDGMPYEVGSVLARVDPDTSWRVVKIQPKQVVLRCGDMTRVLKIAADSAVPDQSGQENGQPAIAGPADPNEVLIEQ
jgi:hypothetical protein